MSNCCFRSQTTSSVQLIPSATASATTNNYLCEVVQNLCAKACCGSSNIPPTYNLSFNYTGYTQIGTTYLLNIAVTGTVVYPVSCNQCSSCGNNTAIIATNIVIPITSTTGAPTAVTLTPSETAGVYDLTNYKKFIMRTPLNVVVTLPAAA